eukprot:1010777-Prorocentrum_minimum.AAC.1
MVRHARAAAAASDRMLPPARPATSSPLPPSSPPSRPYEPIWYRSVCNFLELAIRKRNEITTVRLFAANGIKREFTNSLWASSSRLASSSAGSKAEHWSRAVRVALAREVRVASAACLARQSVCPTPASTRDSKWGSSSGGTPPRSTSTLLRRGN